MQVIANMPSWITNPTTRTRCWSLPVLGDKGIIVSIYAIVSIVSIASIASIKK
jgi:hypothetical protein